MRLIVIFAAAAFAVLAFIVVYQMNSTAPAGDGPQALVDPKTRNTEVKQVNVMVAKKDIPIGTKLTSEDLDIQPWPSHLKLEQFVNADDQTIEGMVTRSPFLQFEPIIRNKLANPNDPSFLASSLPAGMRAATIPIDAVTGIAGFVFPGDRVDVLITQNIPDGKKADVNADQSRGSDTINTDEKGTAITEVLVPNAKVLAIDQKSTIDAKDKVNTPSSITLEVSLKDAQKLKLAEKSGTLSLSLRSLKDKDSTDVARPVGAGDLSRTTPPSFFPVLYGFNDDTAPVTAEGEDMKAVGLDTVISVVRGVKAETIEVNRP